MRRKADGSSFGILKLFSVYFFHCILSFLCHSIVMCFCKKYLASDVLVSHFPIDMSSCFCHFVLSCSSVVLLLCSLSFSSVVVFCHVALCCFLPSSFDVFISHSVFVISSRVLLLTLFDMVVEGHA